ncbi:MAG: hypothetical protein KGR26_07915, partial [Cyanobacteria bacterium REEB65]|nr:hypothetical protein [Cyanobacteria bacterium REEB65]
NPFILEGETPRYLPEDWAFCERAREAGYRCYVDFDVKLRHYGTIAYQMREIDGKLPYRPSFAMAAELDAAAAEVGELLDPQARMSKSVEDIVVQFKDIQRLVVEMVNRENSNLEDVF